MAILIACVSVVIMSIVGSLTIIIRPMMGKQHLGFKSVHDDLRDDKRISWHEVWMNFALFLANGRSNDPRLKVGCIIVANDNTRVLGLGYNGSYAGGPNDPESLEPGKSGFVHAEINALIKCDFYSHVKKIMYVTHSPCKDCARCIVNARIHTVIYNELYRSKDGIDLLKSAGVNVFQINEVVGQYLTS
jgi:dCMP deaminase